MKNVGKYTLSGYVTRFAILLALVVVLQIWGSGLKIGTVTLSLVLIPIVFGGMILGPLSGALLGLAFGVITLVAGITGADAFTLILFEDHPFYTALICIVKAVSAGFFPALIYSALAKKNDVAATFVASAAAPVINTGLFILGALLMVRDTLTANFVNGTSVIYFLIIGCAGVNFLIELALNLVVAPALVRVTRALEKRGSGKGDENGEKI